MASSQRSPLGLLDAARLLREREPELAARLELVFAGPLTPEERDQLAAADLDGMVRHVGNLERAESLRLQREADSLLLLTAGSRRGEATGKLFEYLGAERPILVLGEHSEAARIVRAARAGLAAPVDDPAAIAVELERLVSGALPVDAAPETYAYPALAQRYAEVVELARERRNTRP
jgi:glycosyltransferase involved in cell wall biosynthesis